MISKSNAKMTRSPVIGSFLYDVFLMFQGGGSCFEKEGKGQKRPGTVPQFQTCPLSPCLCCTSLLSAIMFGLLFIHVKPESLNLDLFAVSDKTIYAPATVEDQQATESKKQAAEDAVEDQYTLKKAIPTTGLT